MVAVASKHDLKYPVTPEWKAGVRTELKKRGRGSHSWLANEIGATTGELSDLLGPDSKYSDLVAPIHKAFGWPAPRPPLAGSPDVLELDYIIERAKLSSEEREWILKQVDASLKLLKARKND